MIGVGRVVGLVYSGPGYYDDVDGTCKGSRIDVLVVLVGGTYRIDCTPEVVHGSRRERMARERWGSQPTLLWLGPNLPTPPDLGAPPKTHVKARLLGASKHKNGNRRDSDRTRVPSAEPLAKHPPPSAE